MHEKIKALRTSFEKGGKQPTAATASQSGRLTYIYLPFSFA